VIGLSGPVGSLERILALSRERLSPTKRSSPAWACCECLYHLHGKCCNSVSLSHGEVIPNITRPACEKSKHFNAPSSYRR